ncbi:MAG: ABC transporter permease [Firmicutes bacterium]|nr:ABC transporter permease [Bacillota bacterium]
MFDFYLRLAAKNLFRHKRRTFLTAAAIGVGVVFYLWLDSFLLGFEKDALGNILDHQTAEVQVVTKATVEEDSPELKKTLIPRGLELAKEIALLPGVRAVSPRLFFPLTAGNGLDEIPLLGVGVDPAAEAATFTNARFVKAGRWLEPGQAEAVLGEKVARLLELGVGDTLIVRTRTRMNTVQAFDLTIVGLLATPNPNVNEGWLFLPLDFAGAALATEGTVSQIEVRGPAAKEADRLATRIKTLPGLPPGVVVRTWRESAAALLAMLQAERQYDSLFLLLVIAIAVIGVINAILLASLERVREIGMLKALGMTERQIRWVFVTEGILLGGLGWLFGALMALPMNYWMVEIGYDLEAFLGEMTADFGYAISGRVYGVWNWGTFLAAFFISLLVALVASYFPARKASRLDPAVALRRL